MRIFPHEYIDSDSFVNSYKSYKLSDKRGLNGSMQNELSCLDRKPPTESFKYQLSINHSKKNYLRFINDISSEFNNSFLIDRPFSKNISN